MKFLNLEKLYRENRIFYWNNALGEINLPDDDGLISHTPDELPLFQRDLYENYWCGVGMEYIVTVDGIPGYMFCFLLEDEYASDLGITPETLHVAAQDIARIKFVGSIFDGCKFLFGEKTDPCGAELMIFLPYSKRENIAMIRAGIASGEYDIYSVIENHGGVKISPNAVPTLFDRMIKALFSLRPIYITDGTVTRLLTVAEHIGDTEVRCRLDNGSFLFLYPGFEKDLGGEIDLMEAEEGYYLAPKWWIDL